MTAEKTITETRGYARPDSKSAKLWERAQSVMPGGNSRTTVFMAPRPIYAAAEDREVRGRVPRLVRLGRGEPRLRAGRVGTGRCAGEHRVFEGHAAIGARRRRRAAVQPDRSRRGADREGGEASRRGPHRP